jgi:thiosulfate/3-mercaptopyruvate sulfurtransferase
MNTKRTKRLIALAVGSCFLQAVMALAAGCTKSGGDKPRNETSGVSTSATEHPTQAGTEHPSSAPGATTSSEPPLIQPDDLARLLASPGGDRPLIIHVGFRKLYEQAHIAGSEFMGPASSDDVLAALRKRLDGESRTRSIVVYCGCCPWNHCPNVQPAARLLQEMGFKNARLLHLPQNLETDWVARGYAVAEGP